LTSTMSTLLIDSPAVLDELPAGTEIRDADGDTGTKTREGAWKVIGFAWDLDPDWFAFPVRVINPTPETAELVADLSGPNRLPEVMAELRGIVADIKKMYERQEAERDELRDENGDVPGEDLRRWDELRCDVHMEQDSDKLGAVLGRLERLVNPERDE